MLERDSFFSGTVAIGQGVMGSNLNRLDIRKFFTVRVVRHRNGLSKEAVNAPSLAVFKATLDRTFGDMV